MSFIYIYIYIYFTQYLQWLTTKSFQIFLSQTSLNSISIKIQTQITNSKLIKPGKGKKKKKRKRQSKPDPSESRWGGGQVVVGKRTGMREHSLVISVCVTV